MYVTSLPLFVIVPPCVLVRSAENTVNGSCSASVSFDNTLIVIGVSCGVVAVSSLATGAVLTSFTVTVISSESDNVPSDTTTSKV